MSAVTWVVKELVDFLGTQWSRTPAAKVLGQGAKTVFVELPSLECRQGPGYCRRLEVDAKRHYSCSLQMFGKGACFEDQPWRMLVRRRHAHDSEERRFRYLRRTSMIRGAARLGAANHEEHVRLTGSARRSMR